MTDLEPLTDGRDTHVNQSFPRTAPFQAKTALLRGGSNAQSRVLLAFGRLAEAVRGEDVLSAVLSNEVVGSWAGTTLTVQPIAGKAGKAPDAAGWSVKFQTWENQPEVRAGSASKSTGAIADGGRFEIDVTSLVRQVAAGQPDYGWRISSSINGDRRVKTFDAGGDSWRLDIVVRDPTDAPVSLAPDVGVVGTRHPWLSWEAPDTGARANIQTGFRVQIDPNMNETSPVWDSGPLDGLDPEVDLTATTYPGATSGVVTYWRVQSRADGDWSQWSDWAEFTYVAYPVLTLVSPEGSEITDSSPTIAGQVPSGSSIAAWSVAVFGASGTFERYDSGRQPGAGRSFQAPIPSKNERGLRIFPRDGDYQLRVRVWDRDDRTRVPGDQGFVEVWRTVTLVEGVNTPPAGLSAAQVRRTPSVQLSWSRPQAADAWVVRRNGERVARLGPSADPANDAAVRLLGPGRFGWVDDLAPMEQELVYEVQAIEDEEGSRWSATASVTPVLMGAYIVSPGGAQILLDNFDSSGLAREDRRVTFSPPGVGYDVDIVTAFGGLAGDASGTVDTDTPGSLPAILALLEEIKSRPGAMCRLVYGDVNVPVFLRDLDWNPDPEFWPTGKRTQRVEFYCWQGAEFRSTV